MTARTTRLLAVLAASLAASPAIAATDLRDDAVRWLMEDLATERDGERIEDLRYDEITGDDEAFAILGLSGTLPPSASASRSSTSAPTEGRAPPAGDTGRTGTPPSEAPATRVA